MHVIIHFTIITVEKFSHSDRLIAIVDKSTDNKNDIRWNVSTFSVENKANSAYTFVILL